VTGLQIFENHLGKFKFYFSLSTQDYFVDDPSEQWPTRAIILASMVAVAQLVESRIVIPVVVGSSPISHPKQLKKPAR
jgi:hypothetical protein